MLLISLHASSYFCNASFCASVNVSVSFVLSCPSSAIIPLHQDVGSCIAPADIHFRTKILQVSFSLYPSSHKEIDRITERIPGNTVVCLFSVVFRFLCILMQELNQIAYSSILFSKDKQLAIVSVNLLT